MLRFGREAGAEAVLGDVRDAGGDRRARIAVDATAGGADRARGGRPHPGDGLGELALPVACDAGDGDDLGPADAQRDAPQGGCAAIALDRHVVQLEHCLARSAPLLVRRAAAQLAPDHQRRERARRRVRRVDRRDRATAAEDRDAVRNGLHLVELVRDEDHGAPLVRHAAQRLEQHLRLLRREHRGRLVQDQDARVPIERLEDLDALLLAERQLPDARARIDVEAVALRDLADAALDRPRVDPERAALAAVVAEDDVLRDGERLDEPEVLVHHADARVERVARRIEVHRPAVEEDLALVRAVEAGEDVRERALAGPVLAEQRVNLARGRLELDAVVREDAGKALRDPAHRNSRRGARGAPPVRLLDHR